MPHYAPHHSEILQQQFDWGLGQEQEQKLEQQHEHINSNSSPASFPFPATSGGAQEPRGALCHIWADKNDAGRLPGLELLLLLLLLITVIVIARVALMKKPTPAVHVTIYRIAATAARARAQYAIGISAIDTHTRVYYVRFIDTDTAIYVDTIRI